MNNLGLMALMGAQQLNQAPQGLGMFGGRLGGQMSAQDPLTLYLLRKHEEAAKKQRQAYIQDLLLRLPNAPQAPRMFQGM
jgi:hypothetical protein